MSEVSSEIRVGWPKQNADACDRRTTPIVFLTRRRRGGGRGRRMKGFRSQAWLV